MEEIYSKSETELEKIKSDFKKAMELSGKIFGHEAFRKVIGNYDRLPPINKALFEALATQLASINDSDSKFLLNNKESFKTLLSTELTNNNNFFISVTSGTGDRGHAILRHTKIKELIHQSIK